MSVIHFELKTNGKVRIGYVLCNHGTIGMKGQQIITSNKEEVTCKNV